jgi:replicative DNA helicase
VVKSETNAVKYTFTNGFQERACALMLQDRGFLLSSADALKPEYFVDEDVAFLSEIILDYYTRYRTHPTLNALRNEIKQYYRKYHKGDDDAKEERNDTLRLLRRLSKLALEDSEYIKDRVVEFGQFHSMRLALQSCVKTMRRSELDEAVMREMPDKVLRLVQEASAVGLGDDMGIQMFDHLDTLEELRDDDLVADPRYKVKTGYKKLDYYVRDGLGAGELGVVIGESGLGKSMLLSNFAANAAYMGKKVCYITLELKPFDVVCRILAKMTGSTIEDTEKGTENYVDGLAKVRKLGSGYLRVKYYPPGRATVNAIRSYIMRSLLHDQIDRYDLIIIDYADELRGADAHADSSYATYGDIYNDLINLGYDLKCPVWTASQVNRGAYGEDVVRKEHISDSLKKVMKADLVLAICQSPEEELMNRARFFITKNRRGSSNKNIHVFYKPAKALFKERKFEDGSEKKKKARKRGTKKKKTDAQRRKKAGLSK